MTTLVTLSEIIRVLLFFFIGLTFAFLSYAYHFGFRNVRTTPIIRAIARMFFWLACVFFYLSFIPVLKITKADSEHTLMTNLMSILLVPLLISTYNFFNESFKKQKVRELATKEPHA